MQDSADRRYALSEQVAAQFAALTAWDGHEFWERLRERDRTSTRWLASEILVMALRHHCDNGEQSKAQRIAEEVLERWAGTIQSVVSKHSENSLAGEDLKQEIHTRLWHELKNKRQDFWEANFIHALRCLCLDAVRSRARHDTRDVPLPTTRDEDGQEQLKELVDETTPGMLDGLLRQEHVGELRTLLAALPDKQRTALYLHYVRGWPLASKDGSVVTVSGTMGVSDRMVRHYLRDGEASLRAQYEEQPDAAQ